jgi:hypothetical protein
MGDLCRLVWCVATGLFRSRAALQAEILVLRHQLNVLHNEKDWRTVPPATRQSPAPRPILRYRNALKQGQPCKVSQMAETNISVIDAIRGQQEQLKRLIAQKVWLSEASPATLSEISAQMTELKRLLDRLETDIQEQLKTGIH